MTYYISAKRFYFENKIKVRKMVPKFKGSSLRDLISLKPIRGLKILNTWAIQVWNN